MFDADTSRSDALKAVAETFAGRGIGPTDARFLVLDILGIGTTELLLDGGARLGATGAERLATAVRRRLAGEPVARIVGAWEFWGLPFGLSPETLVPRPDTETLVETALSLRPDRTDPVRILDLGTGTGCILVALLTERPNGFGVGLDRSLGALRQARANARLNGVEGRAAFAAMDWGAGLSGAFDLVVSNPPYIASATIAGLDTEVRLHDPALALDGGPDGLDAYRRIVAEVAEGRIGLTPAGALVLEVGYDQSEAVAGIGRAAGLSRTDVARDLAGHARVVTLRRP